MTRSQESFQPIHNVSCVFSNLLVDHIHTDRFQFGLVPPDKSRLTRSLVALKVNDQLGWNHVPKYFSERLQLSQRRGVVVEHKPAMRSSRIDHPLHHIGNLMLIHGLMRRHVLAPALLSQVCLTFLDELIHLFPVDPRVPEMILDDSRHGRLSSSCTPVHKDKTRLILIALPTAASSHIYFKR